MDENNKYCACTGTDAMFHIKLNQQGPEGKQGPQGIQGVDGISPSITVESSTQNNYQLRVSTAYNTFVTPNLKGDDKVQIDPWTLTKPGDIPEFSLNKTVTNNDIIDGTVTIPVGLGFSANINDNTSVSHSISPQITFPITTTIRENGIIIGKATSNLLTNHAIFAHDPIILTRNTNGTLTFDFDDTNYQGKLTAGSNINITNNTISVTGMPTKVSDLTNDAGYLTSVPSEYVTDSELIAKDYVTNTELNSKGYATTDNLNTALEGKQDTLTNEQLAATNSGITSDKVTEFSNKQDRFATVTDNESTTSLDTNGKALSITASTIAVGNNLVNEINGSNSQLYLKQNDVVAGDNITVSKTATGIIIAGTASQYTLPIASTTTLGGIKVGENLTIDENGTLNATGGSGTTIDDSTTSSTSTWSSSKINSEITTVANEVVQVQGDVASLDANVSTIKPIVESNTTDIENLKNTKNNNIFDISKFTVVGSPTITDDGIASGFSSSNRLTISNIPTFDKPFKVSFKVKTGDLSSRQSSFYSNGGDYYNALSVYGGTNTLLVTTLRVSDNTMYNLSVAGLSSYTSYTGFFSWSGTEYRLHLDGGFTDAVYQSSLALSTASSTTVKLGCLYTNEVPFTGSIDLSQFSITVDGKEVFNGLMESTKPIYDKITNTSTALSTLQTNTDNNFSAVNSALNEKANLSDLANYVPLTTYNALLARVEALETEINGGNA